MFKSTSNSKYGLFETMLQESLNLHVAQMYPLTDPSKIEVEELSISEIKKLSKEQVEVLTDTKLRYFSISQKKALQERVGTLLESMVVQDKKY
jgi:hypothetical protein